jgi:uncharacterized protein
MVKTTDGTINFVVKISKFCNLRCSYCYEFDELGLRRKMSLIELRAFFTNVRNSVREFDRKQINFIWHGGEPLLIPLEYYERIGDIQREVLDDVIDYKNMVQTNLTVLTERQIEFLREHRFFSSSIGVSFDVYGDQRLDTRGRLRTDTVLANMQRLRDAKITFGAITVLARNTLSRVQEIYRFYDSLGISVRFLPFYQSASDSQIAQHSLSYDEITSAFKNLFDWWLESESATKVIPLNDYLRYALAVTSGIKHGTYQPYEDENVFLVDTDGATFGVAETYAPERQYGNVFTQDFGDIVKSPSRAHVVQQSKGRMAQYCARCPYLGYCPGIFAAEASLEQRRMMADKGCPVRELIRHIVERLDDAGLVAKIAAEGAPVRVDRPELATL